MKVPASIPPPGSTCHLSGAAGAGMNALAQVLSGMGCNVSASDRSRDDGRAPDVVNKLARSGVSFYPQDGSGITTETFCLIASSAVEEGNPDITKARALKIPCFLRGEILAELCACKESVAVSGTSGKSTVAAMIGWILEKTGMDPVVVNGAPVLNWTGENRIGNVRWSTSDLWVLEADESDSLLPRYRPAYAVITNISTDHFDVAKARYLFSDFAQSARAWVLDMSIPEAFEEFEAPGSARGQGRFTYRDTRFTVNLPGRHNLENAFCALRVCEELGCRPESALEPLAAFKGIARRLEITGRSGGVTVIDDYAHNPAKIRAAWRAVAPDCEHVLAVWRPHGFGPLRKMMEELTEAFEEVARRTDRLFVLPVYDAGGTTDRSVNSDVLVKNLREKGVNAEYIDSRNALYERLPALTRPGDTVLSMGARDPDLPLQARTILGSLPRHR
ncbi:MAG: Mur ligase family protein [Kiritimatiellia bacterium]